MALDNEVVIGVRTVGAEEAAAALAPIKAALEGISPAAEGAAAAITTTGAAVQEVGSAGAAELAPVADALATVTAGAAEAGAAIVEMGAVSADSLIATGAAASSVGAALPVIAETAAASTAALGELGAVGSAALGEVAINTDRVDKAFKKWEVAMVESPRAASRSFVAAGLAVKDLEKRIIETYGTIANAPPAMVAQMNGYTASLERAMLATREMKAETMIMNNELRQGGAGFRSVEQGLSEVGGAFGSVAAKVGTAYIAFEVMYGMFRKIADAIGVDQQGMDGLKESMSEWGKSVNSAVVPVMSGIITLLGNLGAEDKVVQKNSDDLTKANDVLRYSIFHSTEATDGFRLALDANIKSEKADKIEKEDLIKIHDMHTRATRLGALAIHAYDDAVKLSAGDANLLIPAIERLDKKFAEEEEAVRKVQAAIAEEERERGKALALLQTHVDAINKVIETSKAEADAYGTVTASIEHVMDAEVKMVGTITKFEEAVKGSTGTLDEEVKTLGKLSKSYDANELAIKALLPVLQDSLNHTLTLTEAERKHFQVLIDGAKAVDDLVAKQVALDKTFSDGIKAADGHRKSFDELTAAEVLQMQAASKAADQNRLDIAIKKDQEVQNIKNASSEKSLGSLAQDGAEQIVAGAIAAAKANTGFSESIDQAVEKLKKERDSVQSVKDIVEGLAEKIKQHGTAINADLLPQVAKLKAEYEALNTVAEQHAEAVKRVTDEWNRAALAAKGYAAAVAAATADSENGPNSTPPHDSN